MQSDESDVEIMPPPHPDEDARGYINAVLMPYLTPGFTQLLHEAKKRGELAMVKADDDEVGGIIGRDRKKGVSSPWSRRTTMR